jgi:ComF family protein
MKSIVLEVLEGFISLLYPPYCKACNGSMVKGELVLCTTCISDLPRSYDHQEKANILYQRLSGRVFIEHASAFFIFRKRGKIQRLMHAFKYKGHMEIGRILGKIYARELLDSGFENQWDVIIPVPLHPSKKRKRGFNQSEEFGKGLANELQIPCYDNVIQRLFKTATQTTKSRLSRWENVKDVFVVEKPSFVEGKNVLLVDDVVTTGATLEACGSQLINAGVVKLGVLCLSRAK